MVLFSATDTGELARDALPGCSVLLSVTLAPDRARLAADGCPENGALRAGVAAESARLRALGLTVLLSAEVAAENESDTLAGGTVLLSFGLAAVKTSDWLPGNTARFSEGVAAEIVRLAVEGLTVDLTAGVAALIVSVRTLGATLIFTCGLNADRDSAPDATASRSVLTRVATPVVLLPAKKSQLAFILGLI
jgi:hypothetical protein